MTGATPLSAHLCTGQETVDSQGRGAESSLVLGDFKAVVKAAQICCLTLVEGKSRRARSWTTHPEHG